MQTISSSQTIWTYALVGGGIVLGLGILVFLFYFGARAFELMTGMVGGFIFCAIGLGLILYPAFYLMSNEYSNTALMLCLVGILVGIVALAAGVFTLRDGENF